MQTSERRNATADYDCIIVGGGSADYVLANRQLSPEEEHQTIAHTLSRLAEMTGKKPVGWLGSGLAQTRNMLDFLAEEGCVYVADWVNDDQPYSMDIGGKRPIWIPYSYEIKDSLQVNNRNGTIEEFEKMIRRQCHTLYTEGAQSGRVMAICLHPYLIGVLHRISGLDSAFGYIRSHAGVWFATGEEIVRHWLQSGATFRLLLRTVRCALYRPGAR
jgi:allantoinase